MRNFESSVLDFFFPTVFRNSEYYYHVEETVVLLFKRAPKYSFAVIFGTVHFSKGLIHLYSEDTNEKKTKSFHLSMDNLVKF